MKVDSVVQLSVIKKLIIEKEIPFWGCSSAGRAPALQAGGHGFEPHHLHHRLRRGFGSEKASETFKLIADKTERDSLQNESEASTKVGRFESLPTEKETVCSSGG